MKNYTERALLVAAVAMVLCVSRSAYASGFQLTEQNGSGLGNAFAGQAAAAEDASTIFFNPAGLTRVRGLQVVGAAHLVSTSLAFENRGSTPATLQPRLGGTGGDPGNVAFIPNGYVSYEALPGIIWAGLGVNVPFGLKTEWDSDWMGRFHAIKSEVRTVNINPTVAWKALPWLSVGAGANWQWIDATLTNSVNYSAIAVGFAGPGALPALALAGCGTVAGGCEGVGKLEADTSSWGWNVGAMAEAPTQTRVGVSYRSRIKHKLEGDVTFGNRPALLAAGLPNGPIRTTITLPDTLSVAVAQQVIRPLQLLADFTWTNWSTIEDLSIYRRDTGAPLTSTPLNFKDSWRVGLGANYQVLEVLKVRGGVAYDRTPVRDEFRTPRLPDEDRYWLAAGVQWGFAPRAALDVGVAYLLISDAKSNLPNIDPNPPPGFTATPKGNLVGEYTDSNVWIASAQARYTF